jgi:hypothetical protein
MRNASLLAETVLERLRRDSVMWINGVGWPTQSMLGRGMASPGVWVRPAASTSDDTPSYNQLGIPKLIDGQNVPSSSAIFAEMNSNYCLYYRVTPLGDSSMAVAEVRIAWARNEAGEAILANGCDGLADEESWASDDISDVVASSVLSPNLVVGTN